MANAVNTQVLVDGPRNSVIKITGVLDTSDVAAVKVIDLTTMVPQPTAVRIDHIDYSIVNNLEVRLLWDATTPVDILPLAGRRSEEHTSELQSH